jgi:26S proteasome regulatory subunit N3
VTHETDLVFGSGSAESQVAAKLLAYLPEAYVPPPPATPSAATKIGDSDAMDVDSKTAEQKGSKAKTDAGSKADKEKEKKGDAATAEKKPEKKEERKPHEHPHQPIPEAAPELSAYLSLLLSIFLLDSGKLQESLALSRATFSESVAANRRSLDLLGAKTIYYIVRTVELAKLKDDKSSGLAGERDFLLAQHRTASLRHDAETTATIINLLLRCYLVESNLYDQADKLVARAPFPRAQASNGQIARFDYYVGRIRAVQLNYTEAHSHLQQAIRRAPQPITLTPPSGTAAPASGQPQVYQSAAGFLQSAQKFFVVVELLMGDIPERSIFRAESLKKALAPYLEIVQAVRVGDLSLFQSALSRHEKLFHQDKTYSLILRLRHNVIKTGVRMISLAYSRISLKDLTKKLHLDSEEDAEYIVAKVIRDGVIEAKVNHGKGWVESREKMDIYATNEPQTQFQQRINFCLQLHNESVKVSIAAYVCVRFRGEVADSFTLLPQAMRYPLNHHKAELAKAALARERERELANEIADADMDDSDDEWI